jgi:hypothetical protein
MENDKKVQFRDIPLKLYEKILWINFLTSKCLYDILYLAKTTRSMAARSYGGFFILQK